MIWHLLIVNLLPFLPTFTHVKVLLLFNNGNKFKYFTPQNSFLEDAKLQKTQSVFFPQPTMVGTKKKQTNNEPHKNVPQKTLGN